MFSIYFADTKGQVSSSDAKVISDLILNQNTYIVREGSLIELDETLDNYKIGDVFLTQNFLCVVAYANISLPKPFNYNWSLYIKNILILYEIDTNTEIQIFINNLKNTFRDTQTLQSQYEVIAMMIGDLTTTYKRVYVK